MRLEQCSRSIATLTLVGLTVGLGGTSARAQVARDSATVELTVAELQRLARAVREARASSAPPPVVYVLPPSAPYPEPAPAAGADPLVTRLDRIERSLAGLERERTSEREAPRAETSDRTALGRTTASESSELARLRAELAETRAALADERERQRERTGVADRRDVEALARAERDREREAERLAARERESRREVDRLREDLRRLERDRETERRAVDRRLSGIEVDVPAPAAPTGAATRTSRSTTTVERAAAPTLVDLSAVLFAVGSAAVGADDAVALAAAADAFRETPGELLLRGWSSPDGNAAANERLSRRRALAVRDALVLRGVPPTAIRVLEGGIDTSSASAAVARRVEIQLRRG